MLNAADVNAVTGDLSVTLLEQAGLLRKRYPDSVDAYALFFALYEIREFFEDEQGIPTSDANAINSSLLEGIRGLIHGGFLQRIEIPSNEVIRAIIIGLASLHKSVD